MGGGTSSMTTSMEELLTTTYMIGRAIAAISSPGMFRIYDFHSSKAPKLKSAATRQFAFNFHQEESDEEEDEPLIPDPSNYEHLFSVTVGDEVIYLEDPLGANESGWTPLHTCCMSFLTVSAGLKLIDETVRRGGNLDTKTLTGPGSFNKGWTPLQMACAYGVEPLVEKLVSEGANVNARNCFGYTGTLEACHRGFINVVNFLLRGGVDLAYIPSDEDSMASPFVSSPAQSALGEAARCGFPKIVQALLEAGAPKDLQNSIGWTALHEACFYNRAEVVKTLLLSGANAAVRTNSGALPFHLAGLQMIRTMVEDMGGPAAVPGPGDTIDMVAILTELTMAETTIIAGADGSFEVVRHGDKPSHSHSSINNNASRLLDDSPSPTTPAKQAVTRQAMRHDEVDEKSSGLLHSGPVLGDLPSIGAKSSPSKYGSANSTVSQALDLSSPHRMAISDSSQDITPSRKADSKQKHKKKKTPLKDAPPKDCPMQYLCQLSHRPMSDPVKSIYGHVFENSVINSWFATQGKICPITGAPLSQIELTPQNELGNEIRQWILQRSRQSEHGVESSSSASATGAGAKVEVDDLYEF